MKKLSTLPTYPSHWQIPQKQRIYMLGIIIRDGVNINLLFQIYNIYILTPNTTFQSLQPFLVNFNNFSCLTKIRIDKVSKIWSVRVLCIDS